MLLFCTQSTPTKYTLAVKAEGTFMAFGVGSLKGKSAALLGSFRTLNPMGAATQAEQDDGDDRCGGETAAKSEASSAAEGSPAAVGAGVPADSTKPLTRAASGVSALASSGASTLAGSASALASRASSGASALASGASSGASKLASSTSSSASALASGTSALASGASSGASSLASGATAVASGALTSRKWGRSPLLADLLYVRTLLTHLLTHTLTYPLTCLLVGKWGLDVGPLSLSSEGMQLRPQCKLATKLGNLHMGAGHPHLYAHAYAYACVHVHHLTGAQITLTWSLSLMTSGV